MKYQFVLLLFFNLNFIDFNNYSSEEKYTSTTSSSSSSSSSSLSSSSETITEMSQSSLKITESLTKTSQFYSETTSKGEEKLEETNIRKKLSEICLESRKNVEREKFLTEMAGPGSFAEPVNHSQKCATLVFAGNGPDTEHRQIIL